MSEMAAARDTTVRPPPPARRWTSERITGHALMALWIALGLSLVSRIAKAHGGRAWIEDVEGGGARVLFSISAVPAERLPKDTAQAAE